MKAIGDRLLTKGRERSTLVGTISRTGQTIPTPIQIVSEISGKLRFQEQGAGGKTLGTDGQTPWIGTGSLAQSDSDLLETLINDSPEHFFVGQMTGLPTRFYGAHFRMDDGRTPNYSGPFYDVYEVGDTVRATASTERRAKVYCLNSKSLFLERVHYQLERGTAKVRVEVLLSDWKPFQNQQFPTKIVRTENGVNVFTVAITAAAVSPELADGVFSPVR